MWYSARCLWLRSAYTHFLLRSVCFVLGAVLLHVRFSFLLLILSGNSPANHTPWSLLLLSTRHSRCFLHLVNCFVSIYASDGNWRWFFFFIHSPRFVSRINSLLLFFVLREQCGLLLAIHSVLPICTYSLCIYIFISNSIQPSAVPPQDLSTFINCNNNQPTIDRAEIKIFCSFTFVHVHRNAYLLWSQNVYHTRLASYVYNTRIMMATAKVTERGLRKRNEKSEANVQWKIETE